MNEILKCWLKLNFQTEMLRMSAMISHHFPLLDDREWYKSRYQVEQKITNGRTRENYFVIVADLVNFAQIIVLRLGDDYIVPKRRLAADSYPSPLGNSTRDSTLREHASNFPKLVYFPELYVSQQNNSRTTVVFNYKSRWNGR